MRLDYKYLIGYLYSIPYKLKLDPIRKLFAEFRVQWILGPAKQKEAGNGSLKQQR